MSSITLIVIVLTVLAAIKLSRMGVKRSQDSAIGGVCAGLAHHFDLPVAAVRILAVVLLFVGVGLLAYIVLALVLPKESSAQ